MALRTRRATKEQFVTNSRKRKSAEETIAPLTTKRTRKQVNIADKDAKLPAKRQTKRTQKVARKGIDTNDPKPSTSKQTHMSAKPTDEQSITPPPQTKKRTRKVLNKKERAELCDYLNSVDPTVLVDAAQGKLDEQLMSSSLREFTNKLFENDQLLRSILVHHREKFVNLFKECQRQKGVDSFLRLQLQWHHHCSAFLLSKEYSLTEINLDESAEASVASIRERWLDFCEDNHVPIDDSKRVIIAISASVYELLLERSGDFQKNLHDAIQLPTNSVEASREQHEKLTDGDDVYLRFGGGALCAMLHLHYEEIKNCSETRQNILSQEITILQAMKMKDKSKLPQYLMYRDDGYMYFPDIPFIPFLRSIDELVKSVVNAETIQDDDQIIKVTTVWIDTYCIITGSTREGEKTGIP